MHMHIGHIPTYERRSINKLQCHSVSFPNIKNPKYTFCREFNSEYQLSGQKDLPHPPYSRQSDLAHSDYHLFGPMKKMLDGQKFASDTKVQSVVRQWLGQQPVSFFVPGIQKLFDRWDKCLNELGRYAGK